MYSFLGRKRIYKFYSICIKNFVKKIKKLGINIIAENEPYFCSSCKLIVNKQCKVKKYVNAKKIRISILKIRNLVRNKPVPNFNEKRDKHYFGQKSII